MWRIELLGGLRVQHADRVTTRFPTQKAAALLAYLAYHPQHPHRREALIEQLWPEIDLDAARSSLRTALSSLRQLLEPETSAAGQLLVASRSMVSLHPAAFTTDVAEFRAALRTAGGRERPPERAARLSAAVAVYRGELLPGCYEPWILQERRFLAEAYLDGLHQLVTALEQEGELERAVEVARQAVSTDPLREEAHLDLMCLSAAAGQPSAVLRQYQDLERLVRQEWGEPPSAAARARSEELRQRADEVAYHQAVEAPGRPSRSPVVADPRPSDPPPSETQSGTQSPVQPGQHAPPRPPPFHRNLPLEPEEYAHGHVPGAVNLPQCDLASRLDDLPRDRSLWLICQAGPRSRRAAQFLKQMGFEPVAHAQGGTSAWAAAGKPLAVSETPTAKPRVIESEWTHADTPTAPGTDG